MLLIYFTNKRVEDRHLRGNGKLGKERLVARLSSDAVLGLKIMQEKGLGMGMLACSGKLPRLPP